MKPPFRERWRFATAVWALGGRRYGVALRRLDALAEMRPLSLAKRALRARLLLGTGSPEAAHDLFLEVREAALGPADAEADYIRRYAQFWLAIIRRHPFDARRELREAAAIAAAPRLKRLLRLPAPDALDDPLVTEFDAWLEANPPGEGDLRKRRSG